MEHEARIGYLCYQGARMQLNLDEECEMLGYTTIDPKILHLIAFERLLLKKMILLEIPLLK